MKAGRNEPCPCGSGKKLKKCCGQREGDEFPAQSLRRQEAAPALTSAAKAPVLTSTPTPVECNQLVALFQAGRHAELDNLARKLIGQYPHFGFVWKIWGVSLQLRGKDEALPVLQKASVLMPEDVGAHSNLGNALLKLGRHGEAVASYRRALAIKSDYAEAHYNLGIALKAMGQLDDALASYRQALAIEPDYVKAHYNLGNALRDLDRFDDAVASYRQALAFKPDYAEAYLNLSFVLLELGRHDEIVASCRQALALRPNYAEAHYSLGNVLYDLGEMDQAIQSYQKVFTIDPDNLGLLAASLLAVLYYLKGDFAQCKDMLARSLKVREVNERDQMFARIYWNYVASLVSYNDQFGWPNVQAGQNATLYVIGESHSLSTHGAVIGYREQAMRCSAQWIVGCKQWHLGNDQANRYKRRFEIVTDSLPVNSTVLLVIGEIDCRPDEGIITVCKKHPELSLDEVAQATAKAYVEYVSGINARYGHRMIICGVPATNYHLQSLETEIARQLVQVIRLVNAALKAAALAAGMDFLDVHALTDRGDGIASGEHHIDTCHLLPRAITVAFDKHCIQAA